MAGVKWQHGSVPGFPEAKRPLSWGWVALLLPLLLVGPCIAIGLGQSRPPLVDSRGLEQIHSNLRQLADHLRQHKQKHGRYPTSEEGLAALSNLQKTWPLRINPQRLALIRPESLAGGHFLGRDADLLHGMLDSDEPNAVPGRILYDANLVLVLVKGVAMSPAGSPYLYENFSNQPHQPRTRANSELCSIEVDNGIWLSSIAGEIAEREIASLRQAQWLRSIAAVCIVAAVLAGWVFLIRRGSGMAGLVMMLISAGTAVVSAATTMCYVARRLLIDTPTPEFIQRRKELLDRHRAAGTISQATYDRTRAAMALWEAKAD